MHFLKTATRLLFFACALALLVTTRESFGAEATFALKDKPGSFLDVLQDGKVIGRYMYAHDTTTAATRDETYKPYLHVFDAEGIAPITKGSGGLFPHHRGIFVGWMKIGVNGKTYDRWHMKGGDQVHEKFLRQEVDKDHAAFTSLVRWMGDGVEPILEEERTLTFSRAPAPAYALIEMTSKLKAVAGEAKLDGDPEHSGLQFRPANEVAGKKTAYLFPKENANAHKDRDYAWVAENYTLKDKRRSVVYLNHPSNPKGTAFSAYRDYGRFGGFFKTTIPKDGELTLRVRFLVADGEMPSPEWVQKEWNKFAEKSEPTPAVTLKTAEFTEPKPKEPAKPSDSKKTPASDTKTPAK